MRRQAKKTRAILTFTYEVSIPAELSAGFYGGHDSVSVSFRSGEFPYGKDYKAFGKDFKEYLAECFDVRTSDIGLLRVLRGKERLYERLPKNDHGKDELDIERYSDEEEV